jgi:FkbM family methyltransferase
MQDIFKKIGIAIKVIIKIKNWGCPISHYFNLKNKECIAEFRDGTKCIIRNRSDTVVFLENFFLENYDKEDGFDIKNDETILDIGAHVGYFSIYASKKANNVKIFSFEPSKKSFQVLKNNLKLNNIENIKIENIGVRSKSGTSTLYIDKEYEIGNSMFLNNNNSTKEEVQVISISDIIKKYKIDSIDFLKLDCEGAEYEIILEIPNDVLKSINKIAMEVHKIENYDISDIEEFLVKNNFEVKRKYFLESSTSWPMLYAKNRNF